MEPQLETHSQNLHAEGKWMDLQFQVKQKMLKQAFISCYSVTSTNLFNSFYEMYFQQSNCFKVLLLIDFSDDWMLRETSGQDAAKQSLFHRVLCYLAFHHHHKILDPINFIRKKFLRAHGFLGSWSKIRQATLVLLLMLTFLSQSDTKIVSTCTHVHDYVMFLKVTRTSSWGLHSNNTIQYHYLHKLHTSTLKMN